MKKKVITHNHFPEQGNPENNTFKMQNIHIYQKTLIICLFLFLFSFLLRIHHIDQFTEFLGDQGSAGVVIMEYFNDKTIPLVGPMVSTGQRPGPLYYYLVAPWWIFSGFNPIAPAIGMALYSSITVSILFLALRRCSNTKIALLLSILFSISPILFDRSRNAWNPTSIPLFISLSIYIMLRMREQIDDVPRKFLLLLGLCNGIIIQLHYGSMMFLLFSLFIVLGLRYRHGGGKWKSSVVFGWYFFVGVFVSQIPFFLYQFQHGFEDFKSLLLLFLSPEYIKEITKIPVDRPSFLDLSTRLMFHAIYMPEQIHRIIGTILILGIPLVLGVVFEKLLVLFYITALIFLHFYNGPVPDHYLNFLIPFPFIFLAICIRKIPKQYYILSINIPIILIVFQIYRYSLEPPLVEKRMDISRTKWFTDEMIQKSYGKPFSFTSILSRSFSDYHYRFFFAYEHVFPERIENEAYNRLFLTCEKEKCPTWEELKDKNTIDVLCFDHVCGPQYPKIDITQWKLRETNDNPNIGKIYIFDRITK